MNISKIMSDGIKHIAIIMDGNGRWAKKRLLPRSAGHKKGAEKVKEIAQEANRLGVKFLTRCWLTILSAVWKPWNGRRRKTAA